MTADEIRSIVETALRDRENFPWITWGSIIITALLIGASVFVGLLLAAWAKSLATRKDIGASGGITNRQGTRATEPVREPGAVLDQGREGPEVVCRAVLSPDWENTARSWMAERKAFVLTDWNHSFDAQTCGALASEFNYRWKFDPSKDRAFFTPPDANRS